MKIPTRTLTLIGAGLALVASVALLMAKGAPVNSGPVMVEQHLLAKRVTDLEHERDVLQQELEQWREAAMKADSVAGVTRQENFRLSQEFKGAQAAAGVASDEARRLEAELTAAREQLSLLRRKIIAMQTPQPAAAPAIAPPAVSEEISSKPVAPEPEKVANTLSVLNVSGDGVIVALSYGRGHGAWNGQRLQLMLEEGRTANVVLTAVQADFSVALVITSAGQAPGFAAGDCFPFSSID